MVPILPRDTATNSAAPRYPRSILTFFTIGVNKKVAHNTETGYVGTSEADEEEWKYAVERLTEELNKKVK